MHFARTFLLHFPFRKDANYRKSSHKYRYFIQLYKLYVYFRSCYEVTNCKQSLAGRTSHCASMQIPAWPRNGGTDRILWNVTSARSRKPKEKRKKQKILHIGKNVISLQSDSRRVLSTNTRETSLKGNGKGKYSGCGAVG